MKNWYQNEVDEEIKGVGSRDKVKTVECSSVRADETLKS